ncbi:eCIS core domain-containing protein [Laspinema olomoucense]|uniref:DUF4157 domain-containing protein n=1 Tax=Laspinema olomoucense D3b TaxID=2953688 RepID=A0ABT2NF70_9CYAN|nr:DUF4157 domain-containing protein [Laspinema sp. D3b]MCT7981353.1 DUF4157 domain-containing protein [Laspinema sp. D3b]
MTKEFISRKTAGNFQKTTSQFAPRPFATPQQKSAKAENSTPQNIQCSPESSNHLSRIAITQPETFTPQLTVQRAEQVVANDNPGEEAEKIQRSSSNNRLAKISIQPPEPPSTPRFPIQAKLTVGAAGDKYEQEADRVARQVVNRIQAPQVNFQSSESNPVQRKISIQAFGGEGGDVSSEWECELNRARGGGQPLSPSLREPMEREFGADFSGVRVHTGAQADGLARSIQAKAFTTGQDVFFQQGAYEPGSRGGQELIAHELTHVVQQSQVSNGVVMRFSDQFFNDMQYVGENNFLIYGLEPDRETYRKELDQQGATYSYEKDRFKKEEDNPRGTATVGGFTVDIFNNYAWRDYQETQGWLYSVFNPATLIDYLEANKRREADEFLELLQEKVQKWTEKEISNRKYLGEETKKSIVQFQKELFKSEYSPFKTLKKILSLQTIMEVMKKEGKASEDGGETMYYNEKEALSKALFYTQTRKGCKFGIDWVKESRKAMKSHGIKVIAFIIDSYIKVYGYDQVVGKEKGPKGREYYTSSELRKSYREEMARIGEETPLILFYYEGERCPAPWKEDFITWYQYEANRGQKAKL